MTANSTRFPIVFRTTFLSTFFLIIMVAGCNLNKNIAENKEEKQDGIKEIQNRYFETTKDISLGYIPLDRLVLATSNLMEDRRQNGIASRVAGLGWTERGSFTDAVGPSNGNTRGTGSVTSGRIRAVHVDLADADFSTVWVGGVDGGLWKTDNIAAAPATWMPVNDFFSNLSVGAICQNPTNTDIMYFGTGEKTFNSDAVRGGGIWKSINHGVTWNLLPSTVGFWNVSNICCDAAGNVYVATIGNSSGVQRSIDGGTSWTPIIPSGGSARICEMEISSTGRLHVVRGYYNSTLAASGYFYTDNPATVTSTTWTLPAVSFISAGVVNVDVEVVGNTLYALPSSATYETPLVWKSIDGGANWAVTTAQPAADLSSGQGWYCIALGIDPTNVNNVMVGGLNSYKTTDGGTSWTKNSFWVAPGAGNYIHADHQILVWNGDQVIDGGDGGIFYSGDDGVTFTDRNVGLRLKQFFSVAVHPSIASNYMLAGAQDNGVHQLNGAGLTSSIEVTGGDGAFVHIDQNEPAYQWGSYVYNNYRRSINTGGAWSAVTSNNNGSFINPTDYDDVANIMYCGFGADQFYRWSDAQTGGTLTTVALATLAGGRVSHVKVSPYTADRVFFGGSTGRIVSVANANVAITATDITGTGMSASNVSCVAVGTTDNNLIATYSNYGSIHVWVSTTGGGTSGWTNISGNLPDIPVRWAIFDPYDNTKALLATEMGVYETDLINGASTVWVPNATFPVVKTNMLQYRPSDGLIAAATHGRGLWTAIRAPKVRFSASTGASTEAAGVTSGCRRYTDYTVNLNIEHAPTGTADATVSLTGTGTATQGIDYDITTNGSFAAPSSALTFTNATAPAAKTVTIRVYDDATKEGTESFSLSMNISGATNALVDNVTNTTYTHTITDADVTPTTTTVASTLNYNKTEFVAGSGTHYFYSSTGNELINSLEAVSANLGCVTSNIFEAGNTWLAYSAGFRSGKVFEVTPTTNIGASYTINLYFSNAELGGYNPSAIKLAKTTAATIAGANASNTVLVTPTFAIYNGTSYVFTAPFTGFSKFFLVNNAVALPLTLTSFSGRLDGQKHSKLQWQVTNRFNVDYFEVQRSPNGNDFQTAGRVNVQSVISPTETYNFTDDRVAKIVTFYRLKIVDADGKFKYSPVIKINNTETSTFVEMLQNPVTDYVKFNLRNKNKEVVIVGLFNSKGQLIRQWSPGKIEGTVVLPFNGAKPSAGVYSLQIKTSTEKESLQLVVQ